MARQVAAVGADENPVKRQREPLVPGAAAAAAPVADSPPVPVPAPQPAAAAPAEQAPAADPVQQDDVPAEQAPAGEVADQAEADTVKQRATRATGRRAPRGGVSRRTAAAIPAPPPGYVGSRKPLQVYVPGDQHWNLKYEALVRGTDMSRVVAAMVGAFCADPDTWTDLIARADEDRVPLGELLAPHLKAALQED